MRAPSDLRALASIAELSQRASALIERLARDPQEGGAALDALLRRAAHGDAEARDVLLAFASARAHGVDPALLETLSAHATLARPLLSTAGAARAVRARLEPRLDAFAHRVLARRFLTVPTEEGVTQEPIPRAAWRVATRAIRDAVLADPRAEVIARALAEAPLELRDVLRVASRRPAPAPVLLTIARAPRWLARMEIRAALIANPFAPTWLALCMVPTLAASACETSPVAEVRAFAASLARS